MRPWMNRYNIRRGHTPGQMNGTERAYAADLEMMKTTGIILNYKFEAVKLKLADNTFYTPDFFIVYPDHFEFVETKGGFIRDDAGVKFKVAREQYPFFRFRMLQYKKIERNAPATWTEILQEAK